MRFANPWWLLCLLPVAGLAYLLWQRSRKPVGLRFPEIATINQVLAQQELGPDELWGGLMVLGLCLLVFSLARPQAGLTTEEISGRGVDIVLCLDTSGSMRSVDFQPQNRLGAAKEVARQFIANRVRDRIGLVVFGGVPQTVCPLTTDKRALQDFMQLVSIDMTQVDGTALGLAIATAAERLRESRAASRVILLLTDGRNNTGEIDPITAAKAAGSLGIKIYAVGAGSPEGGMMPIQDPIFGTRYVRMENDLDENTLRQVAQVSGGAYFRAKDFQGLRRIFQQIDQMEKSEYKVTKFTHYRDLYFFWLLLALGLLATASVLRMTIWRRIP